MSTLCGVTLTVLTYSTFSYVTSTPVIPNHSLLSVTDLVNVAIFTHCIACLFTAVTYNNEWFGITGAPVTYENGLYVSTVSVTPQHYLFHGYCFCSCCNHCCCCHCCHFNFFLTVVEYSRNFSSIFPHCKNFTPDLAFRCHFNFSCKFRQF